MSEWIIIWFIGLNLFWFQCNLKRVDWSWQCLFLLFWDHQHFDDILCQFRYTFTWTKNIFKFVVSWLFKSFQLFVLSLDNSYITDMCNFGILCKAITNFTLCSLTIVIIIAHFLCTLSTLKYLSHSISKSRLDAKLDIHGLWIRIAFQ